MAKLISSRTDLVARYAPSGIWAEMLKRSDIRELWLIDCWGPYPDADPRDPSVFDLERGERLYSSVINRFADDSRVRIVRDLIENAAAAFPQEYFDFIYIDAGHRYATVQRHLDLCFPLVRPGGMLAGHDYLRASDFPWIEVKAAVDDWCNARGITIDLISDEPCGSFAIIKP